jgi:hypothetical protein
MDILKYINGLGMEHREALQKVNQEIHRPWDERDDGARWSLR